MDFVERIFGVSPDLGSGALESAILCAVAVLSIFALRAFRAAQRR